MRCEASLRSRGPSRIYFFVFPSLSEALPTSSITFFLAAEIAQAEADRCTEELRGIRRAHRHRGTRHEGVVHRVTQFVEMFGYSEGFVRAYGSEL